VCVNKSISKALIDKTPKCVCGGALCRYVTHLVWMFIKLPVGGVTSEPSELRWLAGLQVVIKKDNVMLRPATGEDERCVAASAQTLSPHQ